MNDQNTLNTIDVVSESIINSIKKGEYPVGGKLPTETKMCEIYQVSRSTLREAISVVRTLGYIETRQGRGSIVISNMPVNKEQVEEWFALKRSELNDFFAVRSMVEEMNVKYAVMRVTDEGLASIKKIHNAFENAILRSDGAKMAILDEKFHMELAKITQNTLLMEINKMISKALRPYRKKSFSLSENTLHALVPHKKIIQALETGDIIAGVKAMQEHMDISLEDIESASKKAEDSSSRED